MYMNRLIAVSDTPSTVDRSPKPSSRVLRGRNNANTPGEPAIADQTVKARATIRPVDSPMSTSADRATAADATDAPAGEAIDSITDTDTAAAGMSGTRPASTSEADRHSLCSDTTGSNTKSDRRAAMLTSLAHRTCTSVVTFELSSALLGQSARRGYAVSLLGC